MALTAAILAFIGISSVTGLLLSLAAGFLTAPVAWLAMLAGLAGAVWFHRSCRGVRYEGPAPGFFEYGILFFFLLFSLRNFLWVYYQSGDSLYTLNRYPYADLHIHIGMIKNFVEGSPFWPDNPIFTGAKLYYHFGMDFFTALFLEAGMPLTRALPMQGVVCAVLTLFALFWWGRGFAVAGFLFAGGFAGYLVFTTGSFEDYQADLAWKNIALTMFLPQRGYLFALPAGLLVLWSWRRRFLENKSGFPFWVEGFFWGVMPYFQIHAFIFLSFIFVVWTFASRKIREALPVYFSALPIAVPFMLVLTDSFQKASMIWFRPGWMIENENPVIFFLINFGFFIPVVLWAGWQAVRSRRRDVLCLYMPALAVFLLCMFVMFGPWEWDNTKLMLWSYLLFLPVIDEFVLRRLRWPVRGALIVGLFLSGFVCVVSSMNRDNKGIQIIKREHLDGVCEVVKHIEPGARVATAQEAYHPVFQCGRKLVAGFSGNLSAAFGLDKDPVEHRLRRLMMGEFDWREAARDLNARYLFWGPHEERSYIESNRPWEVSSLKIAEGPWGSFYDLQQPSGKLRLPPSEMSAGTGKGLEKVTYQNPEWQGQPAQKETVVRPDFEWDDRNKPFSSPMSSVYSGFLYVPIEGAVTLFIASDDGSVLEFNGEKRIDNLGVHASRVRQTVVSPGKGWHPLKILYNDIGGGASLRFWWRLPGEQESLIPAEYFSLKGETA